ncbi:MAG: transposase, partial [Pseudomonadota bacterium]
MPATRGGGRRPLESRDDGTTHIVLSASELLGRLAALVPPKGFNLTRYHGCLAPRSSIRDLIVPAPDDPWKSPTGDEPALAEGEPHQPP